ncbi:cyclodeaminase [Aquibacillus albus]|uniref:Ornithine cyclodeaminase n=1 Tax=Aquibacillus albus TaxID=1168171 RepID=A0ABS2N3C9_9BACI|nr:ornithine cyclodeaminase [Aquibacillus albus]
MEVVSKKQLEEVVTLNHLLINIIEQAFTDLLVKEVQMPPIMRVDVPDYNGEVDIKSAYVPGYDSFAIKISSGFFNNYKLGLPSANGLMLLISSKTGVPKAVLADNGYLTDIRTAAAGAVAAKYLAKTKSPNVGVIGTGAQARLQVKAVSLVRKIEKLFVYGRTKEKAEKYKQEMEKELQVPVQLMEHPKEVVQSSDTVITTTPATDPVIRAEWLHPGLHITAMGSDAEHKRELDEHVVEAADLVVCDKKEQSTRLGELKGKSEKFVGNNVLELGQITSGAAVGRETPEQITVCDLTGTGIQDTAIARFAYERLINKCKGRNT